MILDANKIENRAELETGVCIIGSGAAGITLALELDRAGVPAVMLTGGQKRESSADRDLYRGVRDDSFPHEPLEENRRRAFGGTTIAWGGRCLPLEPIDFQQRGWIPDSGWPISYSDILPYYQRAMDLCEAGSFSFEAAETFSPEQAEMIRGFDGPEVATSRLERWSPPTNFARRYGPELRKASGLRVLVGGHATHLQLSADGKSTRHVVATARSGHGFVVRARLYVLAAGGLENPRMLLCADDVQTKGIGNSAGLVGRFYMAHLAGVAATAEINDPALTLRAGYEKDQDGVYCRRRFSLTPLAQTTREVGNAAALLHRPMLSDGTHRDPLFSATFLAKHYTAVARYKRPAAIAAQLRATANVQREHWKVVARVSPATTASILRVFRQRYIARRRLPSILNSPAAREHQLLYQAEHSPNRASHVALSAERDALGLRRITVRPAFSEVDFRTVAELHRAIAERLDETGTGILVVDEGAIRKHLADVASQFNSNAHHLGATRMSGSASSGVVDHNCRVHDVNDLFVMGGSVFPTGGHANPTLTIVALSVRLAGHLGERLRQ